MGGLTSTFTPYFRHDIDTGALTDEAAIELLQCLRLKMNGLRQFSGKYFYEGTSGEAQFHNITLGGQTPDGRDATNKLSYLILETSKKLKTPHPTISIRVHDDIPEDFALQAVELAATGTVTGYTVIRYPEPYQPREVPFVLALITLDGADGGIVHLLEGVTPEEVTVGMRVEAVFAEERQGAILDINHFQPIEGQD